MVRYNVQSSSSWYQCAVNAGTDHPLPLTAISPNNVALPLVDNIDEPQSSTTDQHVAGSKSHNINAEAPMLRQWLIHVHPVGVEIVRAVVVENEMIMATPVPNHLLVRHNRTNASGQNAIHISAMRILALLKKPLLFAKISLPYDDVQRFTPIEYSIT